MDSASDVGTRIPLDSTLFALARGEHVIGLEPWAASGPGWANRGVSVIIESGVTGKMRRETVYEKDLPCDAMLLFPHALGLHTQLKKALGV